MSRRRRACLVAALALLGATGPAPAAAAEPFSPPHLAFTVALDGRVDQIARPRQAVEARSDASGLVLAGDSGLAQWSVTVHPPSTIPLARGLHLTSERPTATSPAVEVSGCRGDGQLEVLEVEQGPDRTLRSLAARYQLSCSNGSPYVFRGELRFESRAGWRTAAAEPLPPLGDVRRDQPRRVVATVRSTGSDPVSPGRAQLIGPRAADVRVVDDGCAGRAVTTDQSCTVELEVRPVDRGPGSAVLVVPDDTQHGGRRFEVSWHGVDLPGPVTDLRAVPYVLAPSVEWDEPQDDGGRPAHSFRVWVERADGTTTELLDGRLRRRALVTDVHRGEVVRYAVAAVTAVGEGPRSSFVPVRTPDLQLAYEGATAPARVTSVLGGGADGIRERFGALGHQPTQSPDGRQLVYARDKRLWLTSIGGNDPLTDQHGERRLTTSPDDWEMDPAWAPDGRTVVYRVAEGVKQVDVATGRAGLVPGTRSLYDPTFAPSGRHLLGWAGDRVGALSIVPVAGGPPRHLPDTARAFDPAWSPDGQHIVWTEAAGPDTPPFRIVVARPDGSSRRVLASLDTRTLSPVVSDDARTVWFVTREPSRGPGLVWSVPLDGGAEPRPVVTGQDARWVSVVGPGSRVRDTTSPRPPTTGTPQSAPDRVVLPVLAPPDPDLVELIVRRGGPGQPAPGGPADGIDVPLHEGAAVLDGLQPETTYGVAVFAVDASGLSSRHATTVTTTAVPPAPVVAAPSSEAGLPAPRTTDAGCPDGSVPGAAFGDVPSGSTHAAAVDCVAWWGVAKGRTSTSFAPAATVTRGQMATFVDNLLRATGRPLPAAADRFRDDDGSVHEGAVNRLAAAGVVNGRSDGTFGVDEPVQRGAMARFLVGAYSARTDRQLTSTRDWFSDDDGSVHERSINAAAQAGLTGGTSGSSFAPAAALRRDQMASFLARLLDLLVEQGYATPPR